MEQEIDQKLLVKMFDDEAGIKLKENVTIKEP
jgi:hypothetical protein